MAIGSMTACTAPFSGGWPGTTNRLRRGRVPFRLQTAVAFRSDGRAKTPVREGTDHGQTIRIEGRRLAGGRGGPRRAGAGAGPRQDHLAPHLQLPPQPGYAVWRG